jgi:hypothetical protein
MIWFYNSFILAVLCSNEGFKLLPSIAPSFPPAPDDDDSGIAHVHGYQ